MSDPAPVVPRGRHAPPPEVRHSLQQERLLRAAASVFARHGYADGSAEAIAREAAMSKATFYEHFANKEECLLALWDKAAEAILSALRDAVRDAGDDPEERIRAGTQAFLRTLAEHPDEGRTLLVEIIGAGPEAMRRRDQIVQAFADVLDRENGRAAAAGRFPRFASRYDSVAAVGAIVELATRQIRLGEPADVRELEPVIERVIFGLAAQSA